MYAFIFTNFNLVVFLTVYGMMIDHNIAIIN